MNKRLVQMCDELLMDWLNNNDKKSIKAWKRLSRDLHE